MKKTAKKQSEQSECGYPQVYICPMCGLPIHNGRCPGGCAVEIRTVTFDEFPDLIKDLNPGEAEISIVDKADPYYDVKEQWITVEIIHVAAEKQRKMWTMGISSIFCNNKQLLQEAATELLIEYFYRRDCGDVERVYKKWIEKRREKNTKRCHIYFTENVYKALKEAAEYYNHPLSALLDTFALKILEERKN